MWFLHDSNHFEHFYNQNRWICACPDQTDRRQLDGEAVPHLRLRNPSQTGFSACVRMRRTYLVLLIWDKTALKKHGGEAHSTSASIKGACESPPVGFMLVLPLLFFYTYIWPWLRKWKILLLSWSSSQNWTFSPNAKWLIMGDQCRS